MTNNYLNPGRRVRPTAPKLTKAQYVMLKALNEGYLIHTRLTTRHFYNHTTRNFVFRLKVGGATFQALCKLGFIVEMEPPTPATSVFVHWFGISDTGRAALKAASS